MPFPAVPLFASNRELTPEELRERHAPEALRRLMTTVRDRCSTTLEALGVHGKQE